MNLSSNPANQPYNPVPTHTVSGGMPQSQPKQVQQEMQTAAEGKKMANPPSSKPPEIFGKVKSGISRYVSLIVLTVALGLAFGACVLAYQEYGRIAELDTIRHGKAVELQRYTDYAEYLKQLSNLKDQLDNNILLSEQSITLEYEIPQLLNQLIKMAKDNDVDVESLVFSGSTTESTGTKEPGTINVQLGAVGNYSEVSNLLSSFENARRLMMLKSMKYTSTDTRVTGTGVVNFNQEQFVTNSELNQNDYEVTMTVAAYYLGEITLPSEDLSSLDPEIISKQKNSNFDNVVRKLDSMTWYEPDVLNIPIGTTDPFLLDLNSIQNVQEVQNLQNIPEVIEPNDTLPLP